MFSENTIGVGIDYAVIKQPEHMQYVTYNNHSYKINFPNAIYIVRYDNKIVKGIQCYCYKKYKVGDTELYEYAMPNMLTEMQCAWVVLIKGLLMVILKLL